MQLEELPWLKGQNGEGRILQELIQELCEQFSDDRNPQYYVASEKQYLKLHKNIISNTFIIYGPAESGKTSSVYWAVRQEPDVEVVLINCDVYTTEVQFIKALYQSVRKSFQGSTDVLRNFAVENVKLDQMNDIIKMSGKRFVFAIKNCEQLGQHSKPILLYNILEWINGPMKPYIGIVLITRMFYFTDRLQKRVKSRLAAKTITLFRPNPQKIIQIYTRRLSLLFEGYQNKVKKQSKSHLKKDKSLQTKLQWIQKIFIGVQKNAHFHQFIRQIHQVFNTQYLSCLRVAFLKNCQVVDMKLSQDKFNRRIIQFMKEAKQHIAPNVLHNLVKECNLHCILVLAVIAYMGLNNRTPYRLSTIYELAKELSARKQKQLHWSMTVKSFRQSYEKLLDMRIIQLEKTTTPIMTTELFVSIAPQDIATIIRDMDDIPEIFKEIVSM